LLLIELNIWENEWNFGIIKAWQEGKKRKRSWQKNHDLVYKQYNNAWKLGANWDGQDFLNHKSSSKFYLFIIKFSTFYVIETCVKFGF